jgi:hypothetical protein
LNWVVIIAGLIPLWAGLFIAFSNMKVLSNEEIDFIQPEPRKETILELDLTDDPKPEEPEKKGLFAGILGKIKKKEEKPEEPQEELGFNEDPLVDPTPVISASSIGLPKGIRKLWGAAMILIFLACLAYSSERVLDYAFKEYRWVIGTTNPWTNQLAFNTMATTSVAALGVMVATLRTGIYLIRN